MKQQEESSKIDVLVLIDNFSPECATQTANVPWGFNCFNDTPYIDRCLGWVSRMESCKIIVVFANQSDNKLVKRLQQRWECLDKLEVINVKNCHSANDVLREVQNRGMLNNDFLLVHNCATFCSSNLAGQIENFRNQRRKNKHMVMTLLYTETRPGDGSVAKSLPLIGFERATQKLVHYHSIQQSSDENGKEKHRKVRVPKSFFLAETAFHSDLTPTGLWLCAHEFSGHFADNHDFHSPDDILLDILGNEEVLLQQIQVHILRDQRVQTIHHSSASARDESEESRSEEEEEEGEDGPVDVTYQGNARLFVAEVSESMQASLEEAADEGQRPVGREQLDTLKLEINASKLAYNIAMEDLPRLVFSAFLGLAEVSQRMATFTRVGEQYLNAVLNPNFNNMFKLYKDWSPLWAVYFRKAPARMGILHAIEEFAVSNEHFRRLLPNVLHWLSQDEQSLEDEQIVTWHSTLGADSPLRELPKLTELVQWLQQEGEEEDSEEEGGSSAK